MARVLAPVKARAGGLKVSRSGLLQNSDFVKQLLRLFIRGTQSQTEVCQMRSVHLTEFSVLVLILDDDTVLYSTVRVPYTMASHGVYLDQGTR